MVREGPNLAFLISSKDAGSASKVYPEVDAADLKVAARTLGRELVVFDIDTEHDIDSAFTAIARQRIAGDEKRLIQDPSHLERFFHCSAAVALLGTGYRR